MHDAPVIGILGKRGYGKTTLTRETIGGRARVVAYDPFQNFAFPQRFTSGEEAATWVRAHPSPRVLRASLVNGEPEAFDALVGGIVDSGGDLVLVIDEISMLCRDARPVSARLAWVLAYGRNLDIEVVWNSRRPAEVPRLATGQAERLHIFKTNEPADLDAIRGRISPDALARVQNLEKFSYVTTED